MEATKLSTEVPIVEIYTITETHGFEYVTELLGCEGGLHSHGKDFDCKDRNVSGGRS